jgi:glutamate-1-semialdehyde aminotransferase
MALGGAQEYFGITADLATFSKAVANGMPISILTGKKEIMEVLEDKVFFFTTFGGEALSLAAAKATINEMKNRDVISYLNSAGAKLKDGFNKIAGELEMDYIRTIGYNYRSMVTFDEKAGNPLELKSFVQQELIKCGILWSGSHNICFSHSNDDIEYTLEAYRVVLPMLKNVVENNTVLEQIKGIPVQPTFRKTSGFNTKPLNR